MMGWRIFGRSAPKTRTRRREDRQGSTKQNAITDERVDGMRQDAPMRITRIELRSIDPFEDQCAMSGCVDTQAFGAAKSTW